MTRALHFTLRKQRRQAQKPAPVAAAEANTTQICWHCRRHYSLLEIAPLYPDGNDHICFDCLRQRGPQIEAARKYHAARMRSEQRRNPQSGMKFGALTILSAVFIFCATLAYLSGNTALMIPVCGVCGWLLYRILISAKEEK